MVFIRRVRTASGATAVQIAQYVDGRQQIVQHVGSAHSQVELGVLMARARALLEPSGQGELDLGVEPTPLVTRLLAAAPAQPELFTAPSEASVVRAGAARVLSTHAGVLFEALADLYSCLGFDAVGDVAFRDLVIARVVEPTSLLDTARVLTDLGLAPASYATMKRTLARSGARGYRDQIAALCFTDALTSGDVSLVLYGTTTLYFEAEYEDDLRKVGYSRSAASIRRSWSGCSWTVKASRWRSGTSRAPHLACLRDCGLVTSRPQGRASMFSLAQPELLVLLVLLASAERLPAATGDAVVLCPTYGQDADQ